MKLAFFCVWNNARVWAHWNSFDKCLNYLGPVSCFSLSWIPSGCTAGDGCRGWRTYGHNIVCLLKWQVTFFVHRWVLYQIFFQLSQSWGRFARIVICLGQLPLAVLPVCHLEAWRWIFLSDKTWPPLEDAVGGPGHKGVSRTLVNMMVPWRPFLGEECQRVNIVSYLLYVVPGTY